MLYVARNNQGEMIAFSDDMEFLFHYLSNFYQRSEKEKIEISLTQVVDEIESLRIQYDYDEYELVSFWKGIIVTIWESVIYEEYFRNYHDNVLTTMKSMARTKLEMVKDEVDTEEVHAYLKRSLGNKYSSLISYERFMFELGPEKIQRIINDSGLTHYTYELNKEYNRKIIEDK